MTSADAIARAHPIPPGGPGLVPGIVPAVDCPPRICELMRCHPVDVAREGASESPAASDLDPHDHLAA